MDYAMFFAGMLAMALLGGLITFLIIRPWLKPMRRGWESSQEVVTQNILLAAAQVQGQVAEARNGATQAGITAEQTRSRLIRAQSENDQAEIQHKATLKQDGIRAAIAVEGTRTRLIAARAENDQLEIERRAALRQNGIDPDMPTPKPKSWLHKYWFFVFVGLIILIIILSKLNLI